MEPTFEDWEDCATCMSRPEGIIDACPECQGQGIVPPHHVYERDIELVDVIKDELAAAGVEVR